MSMQNNVGAKVASNICTGCFACMNICPQDAIVLSPDAESFLAPKIDMLKCSDCGACVRVCPALASNNLNFSNPEVYAFRAHDDIRMLSSSGGAFTVLAEHTFGLGGAVCGSVFDDNLNLMHIVADKPEQLIAMRGSKYAQSSINLVFRKIKGLLGTGKYVLFTGTPCQVAGLRTYLGSNYDNLYCIDLLCHGVPSNVLLKKYLDEIAENQPIARVSFRDKEFGWTTTMRIEYCNGSSTIISEDKDWFIKSFHNNMILRQSCYDCKYSSFPRYGDISVGDFWWFENVPGGDYENKGTTLALVNNNKGHELISVLQKAASYMKQIPIDARNLSNRVQSHLEVHPGRERFFHLVQNKAFSDAARYALDDYYDVGIVGPWSNDNIGGFLTYYALFNVITDMGYTAQLIGAPGDAPMGSPTEMPEGFLDSEVYPDWAIAKQYLFRQDMRALNSRFNQFVVGSDQIFNPELFNGWSKFTQLDWVQDEKKKLAYAASFGYDHLNCSEEERASMSYFLQKFDAFSVREKSAIKLCKEELQITAKHVYDPVFLCSQKHYDAIADVAPQNNKDEPFISGYILSPATDIQRVLVSIADALHLPYRAYTHFFNKQHFDICISSGSLNSRVRDMRDCRFFVTDSFHGVAMALIFRKDFVALPMPWAAPARFNSIIDDLNIKERFVSDLNDFNMRKDELLVPIDYTKIYARLNPIIQDAYAWLKHNLEDRINKAKSDYDYIIEYYHRVNTKLENAYKKIKDEYSNLKDKYDEIFAKIIMLENNLRDTSAIVSKMHLSAIRDIKILRTYLQYLNEHKTNLLILIAIKDTPVGNLNSDTIAAFADLGLKVDLNQHFRHAYVAVINSGNVEVEKVGKDAEMVSVDYSIDDVCINIVSSPYDNHPCAGISIKGINYALNKRGINIAVLDINTRMLMDSVNFDTFVSEDLTTRSQI